MRRATGENPWLAVEAMTLVTLMAPVPSFEASSRSPPASYPRTLLWVKTLLPLWMAVTLLCRFPSLEASSGGRRCEDGALLQGLGRLMVFHVFLRHRPVVGDVIFYAGLCRTVTRFCLRLVWFGCGGRRVGGRLCRCVRRSGLLYLANMVIVVHPSSW